MSYLKVGPDSIWIRSSEPGFEKKGYYGIRIRRGSRVSYTDNQNTCKKAMRGRWANRYAQKNARRANRMSKWEGFRGI